VPGGRLDGRLLINEMPLYREQVAEVLGHTPAAGHGFHLAIGERHVVVTIEVTEALFDDAMGPLVELKRRIRSEFLARLGVEADVRYVGPGQLPAAGSAATAAR
jgi:phenylacetate-coenzyme A ligase PaaK-like adenylate-forming protein